MGHSHLLGKEDRSGTAYFEFAVGEGEASGASVFLSIDDFDMIELVFRSCLQSFDYTGPNKVSSREWEKVVSALERLATDQAAKQRAALAAELAAWIRSQLESHRAIFLNGL
jgi:hypothetical protein